jgi:hypothetical protein
MSAALQTRCRLNMQPPGLNIYASRPRTENARTCRMVRVMECAQLVMEGRSIVGSERQPVRGHEKVALAQLS